MDIKDDAADVARLADMLAAMGTEPRLRIMRLLLSAHPDGLVVSEIQQELGIPGPTLSHHLEKLRTNELVVSRGRARTCAIRSTRNRSAHCSAFCTRSAAGETRPCHADELFQRCDC